MIITNADKTFIGQITRWNAEGLMAGLAMQQAASAYKAARAPDLEKREHREWRQMFRATMSDAIRQMHERVAAGD